MKIIAVVLVFASFLTESISLPSPLESYGIQRIDLFRRIGFSPKIQSADEKKSTKQPRGKFGKGSKTKVPSRESGKGSKTKSPSRSSGKGSKTKVPSGKSGKGYKRKSPSGPSGNGSKTPSPSEKQGSPFPSASPTSQQRSSNPSSSPSFLVFPLLPSSSMPSPPGDTPRTLDQPTLVPTSGGSTASTPPSLALSSLPSSDPSMAPSMVPTSSTPSGTKSLLKEPPTPDGEAVSTDTRGGPPVVLGASIVGLGISFCVLLGVLCFQRCKKEEDEKPATDINDL